MEFIISIVEDTVMKNKIPRHSYFCSFVASLIGLLFGLDIGVISGAAVFIKPDMGIDDDYIQLIVSAMMIGAAMGAVVAGQLSQKFGRKPVLVVSASLFAIGAIGCAAAPIPSVLVASRFILGLAIGIGSFTAPLYLSELAPPSIRGVMISMYQLMITTGILLSFLSDTYFASTGNWRMMMGIVTIPSIVLLLCLPSLSRSPRWLAYKGKTDEALAVLRKIRADEDSAKAELSEIIESSRVVKESGWKLLSSNGNFRRSVVLGVVLQIMQQLTGINVIMYYAPRILEIAGFASVTSQMWGTAILGLTNVLSTVIAIVLVEKWGRRPTLIFGFAVMTVCMVAMSALIGMAEQSASGTWISYAAVASLAAFIVGFALSAGPLVWVLCAEIQPSAGRDLGIGFSTTANWLANACVGATFLTLINKLGAENTFILYASFNFVFVFITMLFVPETKGVSLETIEQNLMSGKKLRNIGS